MNLHMGILIYITSNLTKISGAMIKSDPLKVGTPGGVDHGPDIEKAPLPTCLYTVPVVVIFM